MPCPRCEAELDPRARSCPACAMPIAFGEEPPPAPLDRAIELDRRGGTRGADRVREPDHDLDLDRDLDREPDLDLDPHLALTPDPDPDLDPAPDVEPGPRWSAAAAGEASRERGLPPLCRAAALGLDALFVGVSAVIPIAIASARFEPARGALGALGLPAVGFAALVAVAYALLSGALLAATPGRLAVARLTRRAAPPRGGPARPLAVRAP